MRIIIADNCNTFRGTLASLLRQEGYHIAGEAADGKSLVGLLARVRADILCIAHELASLDFHELLETLSGHDVLRNLSVVLMSAEKAADIRINAVHDGISGFLHKPFSQSQVVEELRQIAHARRLLDELAQRTTQPADKPRGRVVVAEDSQTQRRLLRNLLEEAGCEVVGETDNGASAVEMVRECRPDLTCLDIEMPVMNGLDALTKIHADMPQLPVLMISSNTKREVVIDAATRGAKGYIVKPFQADKVHKAINKLIPVPEAA